MRKPGRIIFQFFSGIVACANFLVVDSLAQNYPVKPIHVLVGAVAGGGTDLIARIVAQKLSENLGQPVVVENRPGAAASIATERVATSRADGYTLLMMPSSATILPALRAKLPYNLERDLAPVSLAATGAFVLVIHPWVPARNVQELIALARSQPGKLNYGSAGVGNSQHLVGELFNFMAKVRIVHVPYKGGAESATANAVGQVDMGFNSIPATLSLINAGKLRPLAVTSAKRASSIPSTPTLIESGLPGFDRTTWYGVVAPARVPKDAVARLNAVIGKVVNTPEMTESLNKLGLEPKTNTPEQFMALIHREIAQNAKLVELAGMKAE